MLYLLSVFCVSAEISQVNEVIHTKKPEVHEKSRAKVALCLGKGLRHKAEECVK